jgi:threonine synthase
MGWRGIIEEFRDYLPVSKQTPVITLGEGGTPLIDAQNLREEIGLSGRLYLKLENYNPTGSFKDRGMSLCLSKALEEKAKMVVCPSTGNAAASCAAYAAAAKIKAVIVIPQTTPLGKLAQAIVYGAQIIKVKGGFEKVEQAAKEIAKKNNAILISLKENPYLIEGFKTAALEICQQLGAAPEYHFMPIGNGGNIVAYSKGYQEYYLSHQLMAFYAFSPTFFPPKLMGFQPEGAAPIVFDRIIKNPKTIASAIKIGNPAFRKEAREAIEHSLGKIDFVSDQEILEALKLLGKTQGVFAEPAGAVSVAGLIKMKKRGEIDSNLVVCVITGSGLKDPEAIFKIKKRALIF